ncbi:MAG: hypothetical protein HND55_07735 [Pseudomonadota bacterium]|nr:MAG: hypothetical protein HND55_07735 [Pseudomonadota bacterium]
MRLLSAAVLNLLSLVLIGSGAVAVAAAPAPALPVWQTEGVSLDLELRGDYLSDFGVRLEGGHHDLAGRVQTGSSLSGRLVIALSEGQFGGFGEGLLRARIEVTLARAGHRLELGAVHLRPERQNGHAVLGLFEEAGSRLMSLTHLHISMDPGQQQVRIVNADLIAEAALARALGFPELAGMAIGSGRLVLELAQPISRQSALEGRGLACDGRPHWPQEGHEIDVALTAIGAVQYVGTESSSGRIKLAPSAILKNVSTGDAPWIPKFESRGYYPYDPPDQHPFLVWALYRIDDGRLTQLAVSGAKHAFFTINQNCNLSCSYLTGNILGPGCEDVYGVNTNDSGWHLGPRDEIEAGSGLFESTCSFFDPGCAGQQTNSAATFENRLLVNPQELDADGAEYYLDAWYLVRHDIDIFNSMGYRRLTPEPSGLGWTFTPLGPFESGPVTNAWVEAGTRGMWQDHRQVVVPSDTPELPYPDNLPRGHLSLAVRVEQVDGQLFRYIYALHNHDFDSGVRRFAIPVPESVDVQAATVSAPPDAPQWSSSIQSGQVMFEADDGAVQPWHALYTFELLVTAGPVSGGITLLPGGDGSPGEVAVDSLVPGLDLLFLDRFIELAALGFGRSGVATH